MIALIGNDAGWTQISREQVPYLGSNVACGLAFTGEESGRVGVGEALSGRAGHVFSRAGCLWAGSLTTI